MKIEQFDLRPCKIFPKKEEWKTQPYMLRFEFCRRCPIFCMWEDQDGGRAKRLDLPKNLTGYERARLAMEVYLIENEFPKDVI